MACQRPSQIAHAGFLRFGMGTDPSPVRKIGHRGGNLDNNEVIYIGLAEQHGRYEVEFYIKKSERRKGYCSEALQALCESVFLGKILQETEDGASKPLTLDEIYATTSVENEPTRKLLEKHAFQKPEEGYVMTLVVRIHSVTGEEYVNYITEYVFQRPAYNP